MPLFARLYQKKSRQYNVVSKELMVARVELLDGTPVECTLSAESTGQHCLDNVCQRFGIKQPQFFGLKFRARRAPPLRRWLDLERPLKKQLERFAESAYLYLGVMFYVSDVAALQDEMTRTQYFLQLKTDVLECRLHCNYEQAVMLASYCLQAELGDFEADRHSAQYIREFALFPKHMTLEEERREALTEAALQSHSALRGLSQQLAELYYIMEAQQLEGYGQEHVVCRDDVGNGVLVGASLTGIVVRLGGNQPPTFYRWSDITNLHNHKRNFGIELTENRTVQFVMDDKELAKYVWKVCVQQHKFFEAHQSLLERKEPFCRLPPPDIQASAVPRPAAAPAPAGPPQPEPPPARPAEGRVSPAEPGFLQDQTRLSDAGTLGYGVIAYSQPAPDATWGLGQQQQQQQLEQQQLQQLQQHQLQQQQQQEQQQQLEQHQLQQQQQQEQQQQLEQQQQMQEARARALLPQYRQAPDYDTAVKQMYAVEPPAAYMYRSQPEIRRTETEAPDFSQYKNYADLSHLPAAGYHGDGATVPALPPAGDLVNSSVHTYSTPELASQSLGDVTTDPATSNLQLYQQLYKPPPPYPYHRAASSSTPDLASAVQVSRSSPDLVSRKNRLNQNQPRLGSPLSRHTHRTYENLADTVAYSQALSSEELDRVYRVAPASVSAQFVTQQALVAEIACSQPAAESAAAAPPSGALLLPPAVDPQGPGSPSHFLAGNIRVSCVAPTGAGQTEAGPPPQQQQPIYENVDFLQRGGRAPEPAPAAADERRRWQHLQPSPPAPAPAPAAAIPYPAAAMQELTRPPTTADTNGTGTLEKRRRRRWGGGSDGTPPPPHEKSNTLRKLKETFTRSRETPRIRASNGSGGSAGSGLGMTPDLVTRRESTAIPREERCQAIEARISDAGFFREFESVSKKREAAEFVTARRSDNENKNRFKDVLPYEDNRVRITPTKDNRSGYINASHISVTMGSQQRFYIAAQGPLPTTVHHFWQAVWENNVHLIVMLTDASRGVDRAFPYWPQQDHSSVECGDFTICRKMSTPSRSYVTSRLVVWQRAARRSRVVWHLQYTDWADHGCPEDAAGFVQFLEELNTLRQTAASEMAVSPGGSRNTPVLVHCWAGVGRTGVTVMCDVLLHRLDHNLELDPPKLLRHLRQQRMLMVQTLTQYQFVYQVLLHYLRRSRLI